MAAATPANLGELKEIWDTCRAQTDQKTSLITNLFNYIEELSEKLSETESELEDKKDATRAVRGRLADVQTKLNDLSREKERHAFTAVLIDGDSVLFQDELIAQGLEGGKTAVKLLQTAVEQSLRDADTVPIHHLQVVIRVYANIKGLAKTYKQVGVLSDASLFDDFVRGVNMGYSLCDYVDAGTGKECSDEKVKTMFKLYFDDIHCRHIVFGGSADNGYARMLEPYLQSEADRSRITLVEGPPFAPELARIKDKFRTLSFPEILRSQKLPVVRSTPPQAPVTVPVTAPNASSGYASAAARPPSPSKMRPAPETPPVSSSRGGEKVVARNAQGQRVDIPLQYQKQDFFDIRPLKLCNNYHLLGGCYQGKSCSHEHGERLGPRKLMALRAIARTAPCSWGLECDDPECISGHRCTKPNCVRSRCWFGEEMHDVDTKIVSKV